MKYCTKCGNQLVDEAVICPKCGCATEAFHAKAKKTGNSGLKTAAECFLFMQMIFWAICLVFNIWISFLAIFPFALSLLTFLLYAGKNKKKQPVGIAFKILVLVFVNIISGILMLCDNSN